MSLPMPVNSPIPPSWQLPAGWLDAAPMALLRDPVLAGAATILFAVLFGLAAWHKWRAFAVWRGVLAAFGLLPTSLRAAMAVLLPMAETGVAAGLLVPGTRAIAFAGAALLLLVYLGVMAVTLLRGATDIDCGCGGEAQRVSWSLVARNAVLAAFAAVNTAPLRPRELDGWDLAALLATGLALCLLWRIADELIRQSGRLAALRAAGHAGSGEL